MIETPSSSRSVQNRLTIAVRSDASTIDTGSSATSSAGAGDQRARDRHALQLAARHLVREAPLHLGQRQAHLAQRRVGGGARGRIVWRSREVARRHEQIAVEPLQRVEGLERVLEDRLHLAHEVQPLRAAVQAGDVDALEADAAGAGPHGGEDHAGQRRLAAARLADDRQDLGPLGGRARSSRRRRRACCGRTDAALGVAAHHMLKLQQRRAHAAPAGCTAKQATR